mmetsp:Transcript_27729/g.76366  ORF Transcript_27729/g.76366 Transcript_27729/m.76366 type:complete len:206 (+) Transcript_27729:282-899(+)
MQITRPVHGRDTLPDGSTQSHRNHVRLKRSAAKSVPVRQRTVAAPSEKSKAFEHRSKKLVRAFVHRWIFSMSLLKLAIPSSKVSGTTSSFQTGNARPASMAQTCSRCLATSQPFTSEASQAYRGQDQSGQNLIQHMAHQAAPAASPCQYEVRNHRTRPWLGALRKASMRFTARSMRSRSRDFNKSRTDISACVFCGLHSAGCTLL